MLRAGLNVSNTLSDTVKAMPEKIKPQNRILEAVHKTAGDLHCLGFIDKRRMREYDALCLAPIPDYSSEKTVHCARATS